MMDPTIVGLVVFAIIVLAVIWVFRQRIKIGIKGPAGMSLDVEAENAPLRQVPKTSGIEQTGDRSEPGERRQDYGAAVQRSAG